MEYVSLGLSVVAIIYTYLADKDVKNTLYILVDRFNENERELRKHLKSDKEAKSAIKKKKK